jgi:RNase P/RNase MRP subunit p29
MPTADVGLRLRPGEVAHVAVRARWRRADPDALRRASPGHREGVQTGRTERLRVPEAVLLGRLGAGRIVLTSRRLVLLDDHQGEKEVALDSLVQTLRFQNGTAVRTRGDRWTFLDPDGDNETFYTVLYRAVHGGAASNGRPTVPPD